MSWEEKRAFAKPGHVEGHGACEGYRRVQRIAKGVGGNKVLQGRQGSRVPHQGQT